MDQEILSMDFLNKYKLGLDGLNDEYYIFDRKAQIKKTLTFVTVPKDQLRTSGLLNRPPEHTSTLKSSPMDPEWVAFQVSCVKSLLSRTAPESKNKTNNETSRQNGQSGKIQTPLTSKNEVDYKSELKIVPEPYRSLIKKFPVLIDGKCEAGSMA